MAKELTKTFERFVSGTCAEVKAWLLLDHNHIKGEFVLILPARELKEEPHDYKLVLSILIAELPIKQAVKLAEKLTDGSKNELYKLALELKSDSDTN